MLRQRLRRALWIATSCICSAFFTLAVTEAFAQDSQAEAKARVTREKTPQDAVPLTTPAVPAADEDGETRAPEASPDRGKNPEALKRRGGERVGQDPRGQA